MIHFYYTKKDKVESAIKEWLLKEELDFIELPTEEMTFVELQKILSLCEDSFDNILAYNSKAYRQMHQETGNFVDLKLSDFLRLILVHPKVFKNGILVNFEREQLTVGYSDEEIRTFVPRNRRNTARIMRGVNIYGYKTLESAPAGRVRHHQQDEKNNESNGLIV